MAAELFMIKDLSDGKDETFLFVERRLKDAFSVEQGFLNTCNMGSLFLSTLNGINR